MSELSNGVNVQQLVGTINAIKNDPSIADFKFNATTTWVNGGHCRTNIQSFTGANTVDTSREEPFIIEGDEPPVLLGENHGVNANQGGLLRDPPLLYRKFKLNLVYFH